MLHESGTGDLADLRLWKSSRRFRPCSSRTSSQRLTRHLRGPEDELRRDGPGECAHGAEQKPEPCWRPWPMRSRVAFSGYHPALAVLGCGRKLPPLPPGSARPGGDRLHRGSKAPRWMARAQCNVHDATVMLLGKPKGICPHCTDDLVGEAARSPSRAPERWS
ncbi:MAG: hypothetical protein MZV70_73170 [Desulfobacterales bacterium]|nr:hypothetical protein [Desulfobacterales bacterium]